MAPRLLDSALDLAVVPGFTRVGYAARRRGFAPLPRLDGRTLLVTGATSGLGLAAAQRLAGLGARVLVGARDRGRGEHAVEEIGATTGSSQAAVLLCDLSSLESVRRAAAELADGPTLHAVVHNAGVMAPERELTADGLELTFATNVAGPFLLTQLLTGPLAAAGTAGAPARVIAVSSGGMYAQRLDLDDLQTERRSYDPSGVYARTKRAQIVLVREWARRWAGRPVVAHAMHPGWAATPGVTESLPGFAKVMGPLLRTPHEGADTIVWLAAADPPAGSSGGFWHDRARRPVDRLPWTHTSASDAQRLWDACVRLTGAPDPG